MNKELSVNRVVSGARACIMLLCAIAGASAAGTASAASSNDAVPTLVVRYKQDSLATDGGAQVLYRRLEKAAEQVCPATPGGTLILGSAVSKCRQQALARAVAQINNRRLAAVYSSKAKRG